MPQRRSVSLLPLLLAIPFLAAVPARGDDGASPATAATTEGPRPDRGPGVSEETAAIFRGRNGDLFRDWGRPRVALVFTGELDGYIEPCGCTGKENQKGGLSRRRNFFQAMTSADWPIVPIDLGGQVRRFGRQTEIKFNSIADGLKTMKYAGIGFGPHDLRLPTEGIVAAVSSVGDQPTPFTSANVGLLGLDTGIVPRFQIVEAGGLRIGIVAVLGDEEASQVRNDLIEVAPAAEAIVEPAAALAKADCDHQVLLSWAAPEETARLAALYPQFDLVVTAGGAEEPPAQPRSLPVPTATTGTPHSPRYLLELGHKGMFAVVVGLFDDDLEPMRSQRVPLDARWGEADDMIRLLADYQGQLETLGLTGLGLAPSRHPSGRRFAGSAACADCHASSHEVWADSGHAKALTTLETQSPRRDGDPECLSCHVVGWAPQKYQPFDGGFMGIKATPQLAQQGCENCHGPAATHASAERGDVRVPTAERDRLRADIRLSIDTPQGRQKVINNCMECHDLDNSPQFDFDTYWPQVEHSEQPGAAAAAAGKTPPQSR
ncbi:MAG: hypothetical protein DWH79_09485 [Planctomycetota bacterium]|nr:MAG: hypothetical protein DWH79_09485 [Planctomycetota bacterium]